MRKGLHHHNRRGVVLRKKTGRRSCNGVHRIETARCTGGGGGQGFAAYGDLTGRCQQAPETMATMPRCRIRVNVRTGGQTDGRRKEAPWLLNPGQPYRSGYQRPPRLPAGLNVPIICPNLSPSSVGTTESRGGGQVLVGARLFNVHWHRRVVWAIDCRGNC